MQATTKKLLWKIYFWFLVFNALLVYPWVLFSRIWEPIDLAVFIVIFIGFYGFVWEKTILNKTFWKIFFFSQLAWNIFYIFIIPLPEKIAVLAPATVNANLFHFINALSQFLCYVPLNVALFLYAFKNQQRTTEDAKK